MHKAPMCTVSITLEEDKVGFWCSDHWRRISLEEIPQHLDKSQWGTMLKEFGRVLKSLEHNSPFKKGINEARNRPENQE